MKSNEKKKKKNIKKLEFDTDISTSNLAKNPANGGIPAIEKRVIKKDIRK